MLSFYRYTFLLTLCVYLFSPALMARAPIAAEDSKARLERLTQHQWHHGAADCVQDTAPAIETWQYNASTWVLRQNKCLHYEAPFIYLLIGKEKALLLDTGATADPEAFPLYATVLQLLKTPAKNDDIPKLLVLHSHGHSDHIAADSQFQGKANTVVVPPKLAALKAHFGYAEEGLRWPEDNAVLELGNRQLTLIPLPGHSDDAIALYDPQTGWLLTGDSLYPGRLYVRDWHLYKRSMSRLLKFTSGLPVTAIMGTHIEMSSTPGVDYPTGSTYQPAEHPLPMPYQTLERLTKRLWASPFPARLESDSFIVQPVG